MVEDNPDFRALVREWLSPLFEVTFLAHGEDLLERLEEAQPDLVLMDLWLPGPDGISLCRRIRADLRFAGLPVLFVTGSKEDSDFAEAMGAGGTAYLLKPIGRRQLLRQVRGMLAFAADTEGSPE